MQKECARKRFLPEVLLFPAKKLRRHPALLWLALVAVFLFAGLTGHDPWKQDETYSFGIIYHFYTTHTWLVPTNAGTPFMEKPPLYYWSAVLFCRLLGGILPLHDAARLTSLFYMLLTATFMWKTSQVLFARHEARQPLGWICLALLLGSFGMVKHAHDMFTDVALLAGATMAFYGMAVLAANPPAWKPAGFWGGLGIGVVVLSKGFFVPAVFVLSGFVIWALMPQLRTRTTLKAIVLALCSAAPFLLLWPALLYQYSPALFMQWFWDNNIGRFIGFSVQHLGAENVPFYFLWMAPLFAFPAFPLAVVEVIAGWKTARRGAAYLLPLVISVVGLGMLLASATGRALYLLPFLPAYSVLGAQGLLRIPPRWIAGWNCAQGLLFSFALLAVWLVWFGLQHPANGGLTGGLLHFASRWLPVGFLPAHGQAAAGAVAALATGLWLAIALAGKMQTPLQAAVLWLAGIGAVWSAVMTLWLPWIEETRSYRGTLLHMQAAAEHVAPGQCVTASRLGESIAPMLEYVSGAPLKTGDFKDTLCPLLLTVSRRTDPENPAAGWVLVWRGSRPLDEKNEELRLYKRQG